MQAIPLRPLGERRRAALLALFKEKLDAWIRRWSLGPVDLAVVACPFDLSMDDLPIVRGKAGCVALQVVSADVEALGAWLSDAARLGSQGLAARVGGAALDELRAAIVGTQAAPVESSTVPLHRHWVGFEIVLSSELTLRLAIDRPLVDHLVPPAAARPIPLTRRTAAAAEKVVPGRFVLALGDVPVADVLGLQPGDVLVGQAGLDATLSLHIGEGAAPTAFRLHRQGRQLAALAHLWDSHGTHDPTH